MWLKIFEKKVSKEIKNDIEKSIIDVLTNKIFKEKEEEFKQRESEMLEKEIIINNKIKELYKIGDSSLRSLLEVTEKENELKKELEENRRQVGKVAEVRIEEINHTLKFIKWLMKR